ncbi:replication initiator [Streptomyces sp. NPDC048182]|uniref:replication initiator n=1 Tax=Streptomyces sp. NPDC048182 TaxID=3365507 RepID=UPI0037147B5C
MIRTCWGLGRLPAFADLKLWKWAHMLGFRVHISTKSRRYSVTLGALRDAHRTWRTEQARAHPGLLEPDPTTTLVIGHWNYLGSATAPAPRHSPPPYGTARNENGSSRPKGAAAGLAPDQRSRCGGGTDAGSAHGHQVMARLQLGRPAVTTCSAPASSPRSPSAAPAASPLTDYIRTRLDQQAA